MSQLLSQLGIDWKLLIAQAVNFLLLLAILRLFVYGPAYGDAPQAPGKDRGRTRESEGGGQAFAGHQPHGGQKINHAETEGVKIIAKVQEEAKEHEAVLMAKAKEHEAAAMKAADERARSREDEAHRALDAEAALLVKQAIIRAVELSPSSIDDALIEKALQEMRHAG